MMHLCSFVPSTAVLLIALGLATARSAAAQQSSDGAFTLMPDSGFPTSFAEEPPIGLHFGAYVGPTVDEETEFFQGVTTHMHGTEPTSVYGLCFNFDHCTSTKILPDFHAFSWRWEADYQPPGWQQALIENNVDIAYADGTHHRPWAFHVLTGDKQAVLNFSSAPGRVNFQINQNGNVVIGPPFRQPIKQLEVVGDALITGGVEVSALSVAGARVVTTPGAGSSFGPMQWGISNGAGLASANAICAASQLGCRGAVLPNGGELACSAEQPNGTVFFALCQ